ncbi:A-kinase anchor protein 10, mitochondrial [Cynoglossus semilaevis]|uniref:A-kinase anchor protein 10, mitochondrial n=1 Tax=Cynoglossus semilaevis TaxID=244447 RepID=UPI000D6285AE|nr:A-kinase anchor protein 10, mitochondrial [Cynoglossus semilaevis]
MSFFKRKAKGKEPDRVSDTKVSRAPVSQSSPLGVRNHLAIQEASGPSHVAINAISANMDSFARGRTAILKKQPSHMEAAHFGDLGTETEVILFQRNNIAKKYPPKHLNSSSVRPLISRHFSEFLRSHHFCKYQIEVLTSGSVFLADILFSESALFYFSEYMEKEEAMNILQFWLAADNFQNQLASKRGQYDGQEAQNDAMILYDKYFSLQATNPLGFGDSVRMMIESNICREGGPLPDCFTTPLRQAWTTMEKVYMPGFLTSNLYYKYLSDLINSVRADEFVNVSTPGQGAPSDNDRTSSNAMEGSHIQQGSKKAVIKILKNFDEAITVDVASLDPESLYQRPYAGRMTFGKVNELGQFIREAEPEPDVKKSKGSMFSQAMKKWVQGNSDEAQEEMAWQIAKMIVNDVINQSNHDSPGKSTKV